MRRYLIAMVAASMCGGFASFAEIQPGAEDAVSRSTGDEPRLQLAADADGDKKEGGSFLGNIWDNFSSKFRSSEPEKPAEPQGTPSKVGRKSVAKPVVDPNAALKLVNAYRATKKLKPLTLDPRAAKAAAVIAEDMAKHDHMSHTGPNGQDVAARLTAAGYSFKLAAENVGVGQANLDEIIDGWKKSPPHSKNMLLPKAKHMGLAVEYSPATKYQTFWALVIAAPN